MSVNNTPSPEQLYILLARAQRDGLHATVIERLKIILHFAEHQYSISETCRQFNISRSTFHRWMERFNPDDLSTLADKSHEPLTLRQSAIDPQTIELIRRYRMRYPQMGKQRISEIMRKDHGTEISISSVGRIIEKECLYFADTPLHWKKRMEHQCSSPTSPLPADLTPALRSHPSPFPPSPTDAGLRWAGAERGETEINDEHLAQVTPSPLIYPEPVEWAERGTGGDVNWKTIKHFVIVSSIVTNIVFVSILLGMAFFEKKTAIQAKHPNIDYEQQEVLHAAPPQVYFP